MHIRHGRAAAVLVRLMLVPVALAPVAACATDRSGVLPATAGAGEPQSTVTEAAPGPTATPSVPPTSAPIPTPAPKPAPTAPARYVFPVDGRSGYAHNDHHDYPAADIIAGCGQKVRAVTDGVVLEVTRVDRYDPLTNRGAERGGLSVSVQGDDGVRYYGSHYSSITRGLAPGDRVRAGTVLGLVGRTGDAGACHLHFGLSPVCAARGDWWIRRGVVWPSRYLDAWRAGRRLAPTAEVAKWRASHGCSSKAPKGA